MIAEIDAFRRDGFVILRGAFDEAALAAEIERGFELAFPSAEASPVNEFAAGQSGRYFPMMTPATPVSLSLLDRFAPIAESLLDREVLPVRAKAVLYAGSTGWHTDSNFELPSIGFAAYLQPLRAETGALRVRSRSGEAAILETTPGDVIVLDEHLEHSSEGGKNRIQWRIDYIAAPRDAKEEATARAYFEATFLPGWCGNYDVDRFPSYGPEWLTSGRAGIDALRRLGVYELAEREEAFARSRCSTPSSRSAQG